MDAKEVASQILGEEPKEDDGSDAVAQEFFSAVHDKDVVLMKKSLRALLSMLDTDEEE